jgi:predicted SAM-dependent methyltransferase
MKLMKAKWFWLLLLVVVACFSLLAAGGYLERAVRANSIAFTVAQLTLRAYRSVTQIPAEVYRAAQITFRAHRHELNDPEAIHEYLKSHPVRKLQLGAGSSNPIGWLNTDIEPQGEQVYLDVTKRYPLPDGSFQYVFSEHVIEHVPWEGGLAMLKECYRVLAPGGKVRIVTPNLTKFIELLFGTADDAQRFIETKLRYYYKWPITPVPEAYIFNRELRDFGHQFLYDPATLRKTFELAGFKQITEHGVTEKTDPVFQEAELRTRDVGSDLWYFNNWESMAFEAVR